MWNDSIVDYIWTSMCLLLVLFSKRDDQYFPFIVFVHLFVLFMWKEKHCGHGLMLVKSK